jgi:hypothetical protein
LEPRAAGTDERPERDEGGGREDEEDEPAH